VYKKLKSIVKYFFKRKDLGPSSPPPNLEKSEYWMSKEASDRYADTVSQKNLANELNKIFCDYVDAWASKDGSILDLGAGTGAVSLELSRRGYGITALDVSGNMLAHLKKADSRIETLVSNVFEYYPSEKFKLIVSRWFVPHFREWPDLLKHVSENLLEENGVFLFDMPNSDHIDAANKLNLKVSPEVYGYDHNPASTNYYYYAAASDSDIQESAKNAEMEVIYRVPHGLFKSNMIVGNSLGDKDFVRLRDNINKVSQQEDVSNVLYSFEKYITPHIRPDLVHGSIVVLRKE